MENVSLVRNKRVLLFLVFYRLHGKHHIIYVVLLAVLSFLIMK
jgi:hypothetical protein